MASKRAQRVGQQADRGDPGEHGRDQEIAGSVRRVRGRRETRSDHAQHDRAHRHVLVSPGALAEHSLGEEHQHQQAGGERRLHEHQRRQQQCHHLQWPAKDRESCPEQPARTLDQVLGQRQAQVLLRGRLPGLHRLEGDP